MQNDITGEHTCIMLKALQTEEVESLSEGGANWVQPFFQGNPSQVYQCFWAPFAPLRVPIRLNM